MNTSDDSALFDMIVKDAQNKAYDKILEHILEVKRLTINEYGECSKLRHYSAEVLRNMGYIEALRYVEEYIKNLKKEEQK